MMGLRIFVLFFVFLVSGCARMYAPMTVTGPSEKAPERPVVARASVPPPPTATSPEPPQSIVEAMPVEEPTPASSSCPSVFTFGEDTSRVIYVEAGIFECQELPKVAKDLQESVALYDGVETLTVSFTHMPSYEPVRSIAFAEYELEGFGQEYLQGAELFFCDTCHSSEPPSCGTETFTFGDYPARIVRLAPDFSCEESGPIAQQLYRHMVLEEGIAEVTIIVDENFYVNERYKNNYDAGYRLENFGYNEGWSVKIFLDDFWNSGE